MGRNCEHCYVVDFLRPPVKCLQRGPFTWHRSGTGDNILHTCLVAEFYEIRREAGKKCIGKKLQYGRIGLHFHWREPQIAPNLRETEIIFRLPI